MLAIKLKKILPITLTLMSTVAIFTTSTSAFAEYPVKPITLVVPASAGGGQDTQARALAQIIRKDLGKPIQVVNKPGGGHFIGAKFVADSKADGYTIMSDNLGTLILRSLAKKQAVDPLKDFEIIAMIGELYTALIVQQDDKRFSTTAQFIDYAKQHPEMTYGFSGKGGFHHIAGLGVAKAIGYSGRAIPFKGGSKVRAAILGGQIDYAWIGIQQIKGYEGKLKVLGVASESRYPAMPDHPTFKEQSLPYTLVTGPSVVMAPKGTPKNVIAKLGAAIEKGVNSAKYANLIKKKGLVPVYKNAKEARAYLNSLANKWKPLVKLR